MNVIETRNLTKIYPNDHVALNNMTLTVPEGAVFGLIGPNGAGKSTTIRLLLGLHHPTAGTVNVLGEPMTAGAVDLRRRIGFLPTNPRFPRGLTPVSYLDMVGRLCGIEKEVRTPKLASLLRAVDLLHAASQNVAGFSTGMVTRLGIAASLINDPDLLIWDEPTSGLDPEGQKYTIDLIRELGKHKTILVSSHNLADLKQVCTHIGILSDGKLIYNGSIGDMQQLTRSDTIAVKLTGDADAAHQKLRTAYPTARIERFGLTIELTFSNADNMAAQIAKTLQIIADTEGVNLVGIHTLNDDMVDAFMQLLKEERSHGFARLFDDATTN